MDVIREEDVTTYKPFLALDPCLPHRLVNRRTRQPWSSVLRAHSQIDDRRTLRPNLHVVDRTPSQVSKRRGYVTWIWFSRRRSMLSLHDHSPNLSSWRGRGAGRYILQGRRNGSTSRVASSEENKGTREDPKLHTAPLEGEPPGADGRPSMNAAPCCGGFVLEPTLPPASSHLVRRAP